MAARPKAAPTSPAKNNGRTSKLPKMSRPTIELREGCRRPLRRPPSKNLHGAGDLSSAFTSPDRSHLARPPELMGGLLHALYAEGLG
jgi:hypothetical protein